MAKPKSYREYEHLLALIPGESESFTIEVDPRKAISAHPTYQFFAGVTNWLNRQFHDEMRRFKIRTTTVAPNHARIEIIRTKPRPARPYRWRDEPTAKKVEKEVPPTPAPKAVVSQPTEMGRDYQLRLVEIVRAHDRGEPIQILKDGVWLDAPYPDLSIHPSKLRIKPAPPRTLYVLFNRNGTEIIQTSFTPFPPGVDELCVRHFQEISKDE